MTSENDAFCFNETSCVTLTIVSFPLTLEREIQKMNKLVYLFAFLALVTIVVSYTCTVNNCNCGSCCACGQTCQTCTGKSCYCDCNCMGMDSLLLKNSSIEADDPKYPILLGSSGCYTGSACSGATCYVNTGGVMYCCPKGTTSCSISIVNGYAQCSCS